MSTAAPYRLTTPTDMTGSSLQPPYTISTPLDGTSILQKSGEGVSYSYEAIFGNLRDAVTPIQRIAVDASRALDLGARSLITSAGSAALQLGALILAPVIEGNELIRTIKDIAAMSSWGSADPVHNDPIPDPRAIAHSAAWVQGLYFDIIATGRQWVRPNVTLDEHGDVVLEWWHSDKRLGIYISGDGAEFLQSWGIDSDSEMSDGDAEPQETRQQLWAWLLS